MTGIRSCIGLSTSLASVTMIEQEWISWSSRFQRSQSPAKAKGRSSFMWMKKGCFLSIRLLPLVKAVSDDEGAPFGERLTKCGLCGDRLCSGVDRAVAYLWIVGPEGNQAPMKHHQFSMSVVGVEAHGRHGLGRSDVVTGLKIRNVGEAENLGEVFGLGFGG